jgi:peptide/nickel transport system substrate-binding protein
MRSFVARAMALGFVFAAVAMPALAQKSGGTLRALHRDSPASASIHEEATISTIMPYMGVFNNLVLFDPNEKLNAPDKIVPELATAWSWSDDKTKLTFTLREEVKWHDGKPFTSADVVCTWNQLIGKKDERVAEAMRKNPRKIWYNNVTDITADGPLKVTFHLGRPQPSLLSMLAAGYSPVYSCHVPAREMRTKPIGTGPFKFAEYKRNESIRVVKNPDYWKKGRPYLDAIQFTIIDNRSTRMLSFVTGQFDLTFDSDITFPMLTDVKSQAANAICEARPTNVTSNLIINNAAPPFDNAKIRMAMMMALDRKGFIDILSQGNEKIGAAMLPPPSGAWGMPPEMLRELPGYGEDVAKNRAEARKIMESLGYGPDKLLNVKVATRNIAIYRDPAVILIDQLRQIHIAGELEPIDTAVWHA